MKWKRYLILAIVALGLLAACGGSATGGEALLEDRCISCHSQDLIAETGRSRANWNQIVNWMKTYGVELTEEEQETLVDYLADVYGE